MVEPRREAASTAVIEPITVDVWGDIACPWCYIGKRGFEQAAAAYSETDGALPVEIRYHAFELDPTANAAGPRDLVAHLGAKMNAGPEQIRQMFTRVTGAAQNVGLEYHFDTVRHVGTRAAHALGILADAEGLRGEAVEAMYRAHFTDGRDVSDPAVLAEIGSSLGLDPAAVIAGVTDDAVIAQVVAEEEQAAQLGITSVPFFVFDEKYAASGAQGADAFVDILTQVATARTAEH